MHLSKNHLFTFSGWLFEAIDVISKKRRIDIDETGKLRNIDFWMGQEETL